jgi:hypothetical protein
MVVSPIRAALAGEAFYTALAGVATKGVGSGFRAWDDRNAPWQVKKNTLKREGITLAQVSVYTYVIDLLMQKLLPTAADKIKGLASHDAQALIQKAANQKILLKAIPVSAGIFLAETIGRKIAPRDIWDEDGQLNDTLIEQDDRDDDFDDDDLDEVTEKKTHGPKALPRFQPLPFRQSQPTRSVRWRFPIPSFVNKRGNPMVLVPVFQYDLPR